MRRLAVLAALPLAACTVDSGSAVVIGDIRAPIVGACPTDDGVGAPDDASTVCKYTDHRGGVAYVGHAVRGPEEGALENIGEVAIGEAVHIDGREYAVASVDIHDFDALPDSLWEPGKVSLITCTITPETDAGAEWDSNTVVQLER